MKLRKLQDICYYALGMDRLNGSFLKFARAHLCFVIALNIQGVFVNILLLRQAGDTRVTIYYNMITYVVSGISMIVAGAVAKRIDLKKVAFIGIGVYVIAYGLFLIFMENVVTVMVPIAILIGTGGGFFWFMYLNALSAYCRDDNRDVALAFLGVLGSVIALAVPAIAGAVIGMFEGFTGYTIMFFCAFITAGLALFLFTKLPKVEPSHKKTAYWACFKQSLLHKSYRYVTLSIVTRSVRDGVFNFFLNVLLFQYVKSETIIGFNAFWVGFIAIFAQYLAGRILRPDNRAKIMMISITVLLLTGISLYFSLSGWSILLLCTVNAFFVVWFMNPASSVDFLVLQKLPDGFTHREEYIGMSDAVRAVGRVLGLSFLLMLPETDFGYVTALVGITAIQYLTVWSAHMAIKRSKQMEEVTEDVNGESAPGAMEAARAETEEIQ